jgi:DNA-binding transcriptional MerR regulator
VAEHYQIAAVSKLTGLSLDTIRAWERRHALVKPERDGGGVRLYTRADIERLQLAKEATLLGHAIRLVAAMTDDDLRALVASSEDAADGGSEIVAACMAALKRYDLARLESLLTSAATLMAPDRFVLDVLCVLMNSVGVLWELGRLSIAQEHIASCIVRDFVGSLTRLRPASGSEVMLFATPPGELHEFGILLAATLAAMRGVRVHVLGANVPAAVLLEAARYLKAASVVIGIANANAAVVDNAENISEIDRRLPAGVRVWIGGPAAPSSDTWSKRVEVLATLEDFAAQVPHHATPRYAVQLTL